MPLLIRLMLALTLLLVGACGGAASTPSPAENGASPARARSHPLSAAALAKMDDALRERLDEDSEFPILVKFTSRPPQDELTTLLLVAYERDAIGRVDRPTLEAIAERPDVAHMSLVEDGAGYSDE